MLDGRKPDGCIPRGRLGAELFRALRGAGAASALGGEGPPGHPADLLLNLEDDLRAHLEVCEMCREEYENMALFLRHYAQTLKDTEPDGRFDVLSNFPHPATGRGLSEETVWIELIPEPYSEPFDVRPSIAAATDSPEREKVRFCSRDGIYLLRDYPDCETGEPVYYLVGETGIETGNLTISIDGRTLTTDEEGRVEIEPGAIELTSDSRILIKGDLRN